MEKTLTFDFTPDPRVLIALTQTPIKPFDALCELIDNSLDSFTNSKLHGIKIEHPTIWIDLPKKKELQDGIGIIRIRDNGPGMTTEEAERAIKAGYSGNNSIDTLGLFGMGFNISTGKMGIVTKFTTARAADDYCTKTVIDLERINETRSYQIEALQTAKPVNFISGTMIEITKWWPEGHANHGFVYGLVKYSINKISEEIGRRYASILRGGNVQIFINKVPCIPFEHCVWGSNRSVTTQKYGKIQAKYEINQVINTKRRCSKCRSIIPEDAIACPSCGCTEIRSVEERIVGWVGIQRFDDANRYGIDLIRNGRAIKIGEKNAFFEYVDEFQNIIKDYPIDSPYGRIVGEIHLDFVPVDFLKQDFQRSSEEWQTAMTYLRGNSSLQPKQPGADNNKSIIFKLYQGYRKVRVPGITDMYMGYWDKAEGKPKRFPNRDKEKEFYARFLAKEKGYYDDEEWWKIVEEASYPPAEPMLICPDCQTQNLAEAEVCTVCGHIFKSKVCINNECGKEIPQSAVTCPHCGTNQIPKIETPWTCNICGTKNPAGTLICKHCNNEKGKNNPLTLEELLKHSLKDEELSVNHLSVKLVNGSMSNPINLNTYYTINAIVDPITENRYPIIVFKSIESFNAFIDKTHPVFVSSGTTIVEMLSTEVAAYIYELNRPLISNYPGHSISNIAWDVTKQYWLDKVEISEENLARKCNNLLDAIKDQLSTIIDEKRSDRFFSEMSEEQQKYFANEIIKKGDLWDKVDEMKANGTFIQYVPSDFIMHIYEDSPDLFFNNNFWTIGYGVEIPGLSPLVMEEMNKRIYQKYRNAIEAIIIFINEKMTNFVELKRIDATLDFLYKDISEGLV